MSIPHTARYQYIKLLELAFVHRSSIMVESWVAFIKLVLEVTTKLSQTIPHMQTLDSCNLPSAIKPAWHPKHKQSFGRCWMANSFSSKFWVQRHLKKLLLILPLGCRISWCNCKYKCPSVIRLIPELRSNQVVFRFPWNICCLYFLMSDLSLSLYCMALEDTIIFLFYLYTCIIWLEVKNRAQKTLPKGKPVHRVLSVIGYLLRRERNVFILSWDWLLFFLHEKHLIYFLLINSMIHVVSSPRLHFWGIHAKLMRFQHFRLQPFLS